MSPRACMAHRVSPTLMVQDLQRNSGSACGMVQSNFMGTEFTIYDRGMSGVTALSPKGARPTDFALSCIICQHA